MFLRSSVGRAVSKALPIDMYFRRIVLTMPYMDLNRKFPFQTTECKERQS